MKNHIRWVGLMAAVLVLLCGADLFAGTGSKHPKLGGIRGGFFGGGDINGKRSGSVGPGIDYETKDAYTFGVFYDTQIRPNWFLGFAGDAYRVKLTDSVQETLVVGSVSLKTEFATPDGKLAIRPAIGIGYGFLKAFHFFENSKYVTTHCSAEMIFFFNRELGLKGEIGWFWAISGGDKDWDITGGPMTIMRVGLVFGNSGTPKSGRRRR